MFFNHTTTSNGINLLFTRFNPITLSAINKTLNRIYDLEKNATPVSLTKDTMSCIAESARGDIRNAINNLQYYCIPSTSRSRDNTKRRRTDIQVSESRHVWIGTTLCHYSYHRISVIIDKSLLLYSMQLAKCFMQNVSHLMLLANID